MMHLLLAAVTAAMLNPTYSPDSTRIAYTDGGDLYVKEVATGEVLRLTYDGSELILNGRASWVYYEEILGRASQYKAFWWSPDSRKIGFYRFDNGPVSMFPIFSPFGQNGSLSQTRYPKAGQDNPPVRVGIVDLGSPSEVVWAAFDYGQDQYFGVPFWGPDSREFFVAREPRRQNQLDLYAVSVEDGSLRLVYHEEHPTWVNFIEEVIFTDKGLYMARDFETGWQQIYYLSYDGKTLKRLTDGKNWGISLKKVDEKRGEVWFTARRDSRLRPSLYKLDRRGRIKLLTDPAYWVAGVKIDGQKYSVKLSNASTPWFDFSGSASRKCSSNAPGVASRSEQKNARPGKQAPGSTTPSHNSHSGLDPESPGAPDGPRPFEVMLRNDGYDLYALMSYPRDFDPSKSYPVLMQLYGGPGTPYVRDRWADRDASDRWCWENGIIYIVVDPRSSGENGRRGMDEAFGHMTVPELQDYIAWAKWLQGLPYVKGDRIGVEGFSFGGTTTAMLVMRFPEYFRCGVAGGGVYRWDLYDTHYTERFMDTPQANPDGYAEASVLSYIDEAVAAHPDKILRLKLTHGTGDDNVHFQNTLLLVDALQRAGLQFDLMIYPDVPRP